VLGPRYPKPDGPKRIAVSANGTVYATTQYGRVVERFSLSSPGTSLPPFDTDDPFMIDVLVNRAGTLPYVSSDGKVYVLDVAAGTVKTTLPFTYSGYNLALSPDETRLFVTAGQALLYSLPTTPSGAPARSIKMPSGGAWSITMSPSGRSLYVADLMYRLHRFDPATLTVLAQNLGVGFEIGDMVVSPDEKELYVVCDSGELWVLDATTLARIAYVSVGHGALGMAMSPDGAQLYVTSWSTGNLLIVDRVSRTVVKTIHLGGFPDDVQFDKQGTTAVVANGNGWVDIIK
jgi:YVTN family beta-propeller protein